MGFLKRVKHFYRHCFYTKGLKSIRSKLGLTGKKMKHNLGLDKSGLTVGSVGVDNSRTYQYNSSRTLSRLTGGV